MFVKVSIMFCQPVMIQIISFSDFFFTRKRFENAVLFKPWLEEFCLCRGRRKISVLWNFNLLFLDVFFSQIHNSFSVAPEQIPLYRGSCIYRFPVSIILFQDHQQKQWIKITSYMSFAFYIITFYWHFLHNHLSHSGNCRHHLPQW
jgi:hypothetical protein